jgi:hypothetical protein
MPSAGERSLLDVYETHQETTQHTIKNERDLKRLIASLRRNYKPRYEATETGDSGRMTSGASSTHDTIEEAAVWLKNIIGPVDDIDTRLDDRINFVRNRRVVGQIKFHIGYVPASISEQKAADAIRTFSSVTYIRYA